jgi:hypothetical protein
MEKFTYGDTIYIKYINEVYTLSSDTWAATDADTDYPKLTLKDSASVVKINAVAMAKKATGKYESMYIIVASPATGTWTGWVDTLNGSYPDRKYFSLIVE